MTRRLRDLTFTYPEVGATSGALPAGYRHVRRVAEVGFGPEYFQAAARALRSWRVHERAGLRVFAAEPAAPGTVVQFRVGRHPFVVSAPCRVVYTVDEPSRSGFAYGTLPGHPESGEEAFVLAIDEDGTVTFRITALSRLVLWWARIGAPIAWDMQRRVTDRYVAAIRTSST